MLILQELQETTGDCAMPAICSTELLRSKMNPQKFSVKYLEYYKHTSHMEITMWADCQCQVDFFSYPEPDSRGTT